MYLSRFEERELLPRLSQNEALALIGPRRAGKTTLAKRLLESWEASGRRGAYLDLEALGAPASPQALEEWVEKTPLHSLVVLDEVQELDGWVKVVRGQVEGKKRQVIVSGSSASLLSSEIASSLGGRAIPENVLPLSYADAKSWNPQGLEKYLRIGGYPECVLRPGQAQTLHRLYFELTVLRDVAAREGIREQKPLSDLAVVILSEPGKAISAKKTSQMLGISQPTFRSYMQAFNKAFLVLSVPPYLRSPRERVVADAKHYAYDTGLASSVSVSASVDEGRRHENLVAVELARRGYALSYLRGKDSECDFVAQKLGGKTLAVQVWCGEGRLSEREIEGVKLGIKECNAEGLVLCKNECEAPEGLRIKKIEEWLLEK